MKRRGCCIPGCRFFHWAKGLCYPHYQRFLPWKQFVFAADPDTVFSADCLRDIQDFMEQLNRGVK